MRTLWTILVRLAAISITFISAEVYGEGCEDLLAQGVFDTFNATSSHQSYNQWHQWWCNGTVEKTASGSSTGAKLNVIVEEIPLGLSFDNAQQFQKLYQQQYCGTNSSSSVDLSSSAVLHTVASRELLESYGSCKAIEKGGISSRIDMGANNDSFVLQMRYNRQFDQGGSPKVTNIEFLPSNAVTCKGNLTVNQSLTLNNRILACQRRLKGAIQLVVNTDAGAFTRNIASVVPLPTDTEKVLAALPSGTILAWAAKVKLPIGWRVCDGQAGTPDLRDRYPEGTGKTDEVGTMVGQATHTHHVTGTTNQGNGHVAYTPFHNFETEGNHTHNQTYSFDTTTDPADNLPPSTKVQFIMKL